MRLFVAIAIALCGCVGAPDQAPCGCPDASGDVPPERQYPLEREAGIDAADAPSSDVVDSSDDSAVDASTSPQSLDSGRDGAVDAAFDGAHFASAIVLCDGGEPTAEDHTYAHAHRLTACWLCADESAIVVWVPTARRHECRVYAVRPILPVCGDE